MVATQYRTSRVGTAQTRLCPPCAFSSVDEAGARRLLERGGERTVFVAAGASELSDLVQMILRLIAVALFDLPEAVILPGAHMGRIGLQGALVPDLRHLVVAELAIGVADQIGDVGAVVLAKRLQLLDRGGVVVAIVDRGIGGVIAGQELLIVDRRTLVLLRLLALAAAVGSRRRRIVTARGVGRNDGAGADRHRENCEGQKLRRLAHSSSLLIVSDRPR